MSLPVTERDHRDAVILATLAGGGSPREALVAAGYAASTIATHAREILERVVASSPMVEALEAAGVTREALAKVIADGLRADRPTRTTKDGDIYEGGPDHATRLSACRLALQYRGEEPGRATEERGETHEARLLRLRGKLPTPEA